MHDESAEGMAFFKCDFCRQPWADDRPMIEGHRGHLLCTKCLTVAYQQVVLDGAPPIARLADEPEETVCTMCMERRSQPAWRSDAFPESIVCLRCIKQSATGFEKDPDTAWTRPG
ncbi:MAG: hypothetical protein ACF8QF_01310 [Phycisphaerales bacterium]